MIVSAVAFFILLWFRWWSRLVDWIDENAHHLTPNIPDNGTARYTLLAIGLWGLFKIDRGRILKRGSSHVDRFGWSIILYDWTFGLILLWGTFRALYLSGADPWWLLIAETTAILITTIWQWAEVRIADWRRIRRAIQKQPLYPPDLHYPERGERRMWYRRHEDQELREQLADPEIAGAIRAILAQRARIDSTALRATEGPEQYQESREGRNVAERPKSALGRLVGED